MTAAATAAVAKATAKSTGKSLLSKAEIDAVDFGAGIENFFGNISTQLSSVSKVVAAGINTTASGTALPTVTTGAASSGGGNVLSEIEGTVSGVGQFVADLKGGNLPTEIKDGASLPTYGFGILTSLGINIPGLSGFMALLPEVAAIL